MLILCDSFHYITLLLCGLNKNTFFWGGGAVGKMNCAVETNNSASQLHGSSRNSINIALLWKCCCSHRLQNDKWSSRCFYFETWKRWNPSKWIKSIQQIWLLVHGFSSHLKQHFFGKRKRRYKHVQWSETSNEKIFKSIAGTSAVRGGLIQQEYNRQHLVNMAQQEKIWFPDNWYSLCASFCDLFLSKMRN